MQLPEPLIFNLRLEWVGWRKSFGTISTLGYSLP
jgi:hypothetical protein